MRKILFLFVMLNLFQQLVMAQAPDWSWAKSIGGIDIDDGYSIAVDSKDNVYFTGYFEGTVDFDPGIGEYNLTSPGSMSIYVSKLDNSGHFVWAKAMGGTSPSYAQSITLDASGNVYSTGHFIGTADFDPSTGIYNLTSAGSWDVYISKLDSSGNFIWAKALGGTNEDFGESIAVDASGNVYSLGFFKGTADLNPGTGIFNLTSAGDADIYISKLNSSGDFIWAKSMGGINQDHGLSLALDSLGNVYTTGYYKGTSDFDPSGGIFNLTSEGNRDIFISKLTSSGAFVWAKSIGNIGEDVGWSIALDTNYNVYTTGWFSGTADFNPDTSIFTLTSSGGTNIFISKLDSSGNFVWAKAIEGNSGHSIDLDGDGNIYYTGTFSDTLDVDPDTAIYNLVPVGELNFFISKLDDSGNFVWAKSAGGTMGDWGNSLVLNASDDIYIIGDYTSSLILFNSTILTNADSTGINSDFFIAKIEKLTTGMKVSFDTNELSLYPNPASSSITINGEWKMNNGQLTIYNTMGQLVTSSVVEKQSSINNQQLSIDVSTLNNGLYYLTLQTEQGIATKKFEVIK